MFSVSSLKPWKLVRIKRSGKKIKHLIQPSADFELDSLLMHDVRKGLDQRDFGFLQSYSLLENSFFSYQKKFTDIKSIDDKLKSINKKNPDLNVFIRPNTSLHLPNSIKKFFRPVVGFRPWDDDTHVIEEFSKFWHEIPNKKQLIRRVLKIDDLREDWIMEANSENAPVGRSGKKVFQKWSDLVPEYNFSVFIKHLQNCGHYSIQDWSLTNKYLMESRDLVSVDLADCIQTISSHLIKLEEDVSFQKELEKEGLDSFIRNVKNIESHIFKSQNFISDLEKLNNGIIEVGAIDWLRNGKFDRVIGRINFKPESGKSYTTYLEAIRHIHLFGWESWIVSSLLEGGFGIPQLDLDTCYEMGSQSGLIYWIKKSEVWESKKYSLEDVLETARTKGWKELEKLLKRKFND